MSATLSPLPPRIRLRIGVSGHRAPPKLPPESEAPLRAAVDRIFAAIVAAAREVEGDYMACAPPSDDRSPGHPKAEFVIVSSLAEGSDRIVAESGLAAGFGLEVVLPFGRAEYGRDFETEASRATYEELLARAAAVFELDGTDVDRPRAYEAVGFVMLANIDLLITIWDGEEASGTGGTAQIVSYAIGGGIPIVWIEPDNPNAMHLSWLRSGEVPPTNAYARPRNTFRSADEAAIATAVKKMVALPAHSEAKSSLQQYLGERERRWNFCPWYPLLLWLFAGRPLRRTDFHLPPALTESKARWQSYLTAIPQDRAQRPAIEQILLPAFAAADHLAVYYSLIYRGAYVFNFLFAAVAVALALCGIFVRDPTINQCLVIAELVIIVAILVTGLCGYRRDWHRRWREYRRLAECLRRMRFLAPIGSEGPVDRPARNLDVEERDWVSWYAWALRRLLPLPDRTVDAAYLATIREIVRSQEIPEQLRYHAANTINTDKLAPRLRRSGEILFAVTAGLCLAFLCFVYFGRLPTVAEPHSDFIFGVYTFLAALLPAFGAALNAIYLQGDFKTVAEQSKRTTKRLAAIDRILADEPPIFARLADRLEKTSDVMMSDLMEWQTEFRARPLSVPA